MVRKQLVPLLLAALLASFGRASASGDAFTFEGDCIVAGVPLTARRADVVPFVAPPFADRVASDELGVSAQLFVEVGSCSNVTVDGVPAASFAFGDILVLIDDLSFSKWYSIGTPSTSPALRERYAALGLPHFLTPDLTFEQTAVSIDARIPWPVSPWEMTFVLPTRQPPAQDVGATQVWSVGSLGPVHTAFSTSEASKPTAGLAMVRAAEGSPLARMLGTTATTGPGLSVSEHFAATVRLDA